MPLLEKKNPGNLKIRCTPAMEERKVEQGPRRTWNTGGECRKLTPVLDALALALCSEAWRTEQQPGLQKSRRQEMRSHQATGALRTQQQQQQLMLRESAEGVSSAKISTEDGRQVTPGAPHCWKGLL